MQNKLTKFAAVITAIIIIGFAVTLLNYSATPAYAIEQTIEAFKEMQFIHIKQLKSPGNGGQDFWLEFDEDGKVVRARVEEGDGDDFRIMVWADDTIYWYSPSKNEFVKLHETRFAAELEQMRFMIDPKVAVDSMYEMHIEGKAKINIEYLKDRELIELTATAKVPLTEIPRGQEFDKQVLLIDSQTKLAVSRDTYLLKDGEHEVHEQFQYLEYNVPIEEEMFVLEPPEGTKEQDRTVGIGMLQGEMTDSEVAKEVVRQYIQALTSKDYDKAGRLYNGTPAHEIRDHQQKLNIKYIRVIAIGEPVAMPQRGKRNYGVPFASLIELQDGKLEIAGPWGGKTWSEEAETNLDIQNCRQAMVRPVVGQPDRWVITGGI